MNQRAFGLLIIIATILTFCSGAWASLPLDQIGIGGGGWLQGGCFHPTSPGTMIMGGDYTGGVYRTNDFGVTWVPWNDGLHNYDGDDSFYIEDVEPVILDDDQVQFFASTYGGIYRTPDGSTPQWSLSSMDTLSNHPLAYCTDFWGTDSKTAIPFSCLSWNQADHLFAGAGRVRWDIRNYETDYYPGTMDSTCAGTYETAGYAVWKLNINESNAAWEPMVGTAGFGSVRDISAKKIDNTTYVAVVAKYGIFLYDSSADTWTSLDDNREVITDDGDFAMAYGDSLAGWSVQLTDRGDIYVAMERLGALTASGVYCIKDVVDYPQQDWTYAHNPYQTFSQHESKTLWEIGREGVERWGNKAGLIYMTVHEGQGNQPDTIYLADRNSYFGVWVGTNTQSTFGTTSWDNTIWGNLWYWGGDTGFDPGWNINWGTKVQFHPMVFPASNPADDRIALQFNGMFHVSDDGGQSWTNAYCHQEGTGWFTNGYNQLYPWRIDFLPGNGSAFVSNGDIGMYRSTDGTLSSFQIVRPVVGSTTDAGYWTNSAISNLESFGVAVRPRGENEDFDEVFVAYCEGYGTQPGKLLIYTVDDSPDWRNAMVQSDGSPAIADLNLYQFRDIAFNGPDVCYVTFTKYDTVRKNGVLKGTGNGGYWSWADITGDSTIVDGAYDSRSLDEFQQTDFINDILVNNNDGTRIFIAARRINVGDAGGVWMLEEGEGQLWQRVYRDEGIAAPIQSFFCLAQSDDGSRVYAGAGGQQGGSSGIVKCLDPATADQDSNWVRIDQPTNFGYGSQTPYWSDDRIFLPYQMYTVQAICVEPEDPDMLYVGIKGIGFAQSEGIWIYSVKNGTGSWDFVSAPEEYNGAGVLMIEHSPLPDGPLVMGTNGLGLWSDGEVGTIATQSASSAGVRPQPAISSIRKCGPTEVSFTLNRSTAVEMAVYDVRGRLVRHVVHRDLQTGQHTLKWDGRNDGGAKMASGVYLAQIKTDLARSVTKMILVR